MAERCWYCRKFEEHFYWDHPEETRFRFMKVMEGDFSQYMEFPEKFARNFSVELPDNIALAGPNGKLWEARLFKEENHIYFRDGWKEFIDAYGVKEGYTLIFKYAGNSSFIVQIFNQSGLSSDASDYNECIKQRTEKFSKAKQHREDEKIRIPKRSQSSPIKTSSLGKTCDDHPLVLDISDSKSSTGSFSDEIVPCKRKLREEVKPKANMLLKHSRPKPNGVIENSEEIIKMLQHAYPKQAGGASFVKIMRQTHLSKKNSFMAIPRDFLSCHLHHHPENIILRKQNQQQWLLSSKFCGRSFGFFGSSMHHFVQENSLQEGDACMFKLVQTRKNAVIGVRIVRAAKFDSVREKLLVKM